MDEQLYDNLKQYLTTLTFPDHVDRIQQIKVQRLSAQYVVKNDLLFKSIKGELKRVILREQVESILYHLHQDLSAAHLGIDAVFEKVRERYYWPQMYDDVRNYVNSCDTCQ